MDKQEFVKAIEHKIPFFRQQMINKMAIFRARQMCENMEIDKISALLSYDDESPYNLYNKIHEKDLIITAKSIGFIK